MTKILVVAAVAAGALFAQEKAPQAGAFELIDAMNTRTATTARFISGVNVGPRVTGAPYSAEAVNESVQKLWDGNRIVQKSSTKVYRDSEGRERREEGSPMNAVFITDPVEKVSYTLHPDSRTAEKVTAWTTYAVAATRVTPLVNTLTAVRSGTITAGVPTIAPLTLTVGPEPGSAKVEDLGTKMLEGVQVKGTRAVTTIPAGQIGNDRDIEVVDERWYSPELQLTVMTSHSDPRSGETTYKLTNIQRIEQVRTLFEVPSNYTMVQDTIRPALQRRP